VLAARVVLAARADALRAYARSLPFGATQSRDRLRHSKVYGVTPKACIHAAAKSGQCVIGNLVGRNPKP
jgi:hypothetical protein